MASKTLEASVEFKDAWEAGNPQKYKRSQNRGTGRGEEVCWSCRCRDRVDFQKPDGVEANEVKGRTMRGKIMGQQDSQWQFTQNTSAVKLRCLKDLRQSEVLCLLVTVFFTVVILGAR